MIVYIESVKNDNVKRQQPISEFIRLHNKVFVQKALNLYKYCLINRDFKSSIILNSIKKLEIFGICVTAFMYDLYTYNCRKPRQKSLTKPFGRRWIYPVFVSEDSILERFQLA